jgi:hypothetical protein
MVTTREHTDSASFSTRLQLMDRGAEPREPSRYGLSNPGRMAPEDPGAEAMSPRATLPKMSALAI